MTTGKIVDMYELTPLQQGLLFHTLYAPNSGAYVMQASCEVRGNLDLEAFVWTWQQVMRRHAVLRTAFHWDGLEKPLQVVHDEVPLLLEQLDWRDRCGREQEQQFEVVLREDLRKGFDLEQAPLMRFLLIRTSNDSYRFVWTHHHLLLDGWSAAVVLRESFLLHEARRHRQEIALPEPRPFREYLAWLQSQDGGGAESFWRDYLKGFTSATRLTVDRGLGRPAEQVPDCRKRLRRLPASLTASLESFAREHHLTLNTLLQGAWALLLGCYSGASDIVFGATVSGRPSSLRGVESMVGVFINTLPVRALMPAGKRLLPWLNSLQSQMAELRQYEHSSLVDVQACSEIPPGEALFDALFVFENYPIDMSLPAPRAAAMEVRNLRTEEQTNYPLGLIVIPGPELVLQVGYDSHRFEPASIERMTGHLETVLRRMLADPQQRLSEVSLLSEEERRQVLVDFNATQRDYPEERCVHDLFEAQVERTPEAVALVSEDGQLTYRELKTRADQLAGYLRQLGVGTDDRVALCVGRSLEMTVGLLGILKAGGAYVPLDPDYPSQRLAFMLEDSRARVLLAQRSFLETFSTCAAHVVCLDTESGDIESQSTHGPAHPVAPDQLAYLVYTSGSTGRPKGVALTHRTLSNLVAWQVASSGRAEGAPTLQFASASFDLSLLETFATLCAGGTLVVVGESVQRDPESLVRLIADHRVERAFLPCVALHQLAEAVGGDPEASIHLNEIITTGEQLRVTPSLRRFFEGMENCSFENQYGPSETHVVTAYRLPPGPDAWPTFPAIGGPIANTQLYVLDRNLGAVPVGVAGELYIGGDGLARGYWNRPRLTAEKFVPNPLGDRPGSRLYKTGDLVRWLPDGTLDFLGRIDLQVKIRGFRIELGEIESVLLQDRGVRETVVVVREDAPGEKRLVAYVVPGGESAPAAEELRKLLQGQLPDYMLPSAFVFLEALPLSPNGKVDRKGLPVPEAARRGLQREYVAPRTPTEQVLAEIWEEVLQIDRVGVDDNFFELGGHSLLATQAVSRFRERFQVEFPLRQLFERPTVANLAALVDEALEDATGVAIPSIWRVGRDGELPLSFAQERLWFLSQLEPNSPFYNIAGAVRVRGRLDVSALAQSLDEIVSRHEVLRTTFPTEDGRPRQRIASRLELELPVRDLCELAEEEREAEVVRLATEEARRPFDLLAGPLLRASLLRLDAAEHVFLLTLHHIVSDGWSAGVAVRELAALYEAFSAGRPSPLPALPVQYADFAVWQREWLSGEVLQRQLDYWVGQLGDAPKVLELPADRPRPAVQTFCGSQHGFVLPAELSAALRRFSREHQATMFMTLLAAFQSLLSRYCGQEQVCVGTPIAGRNRAEIEGLIGFFVNTLVLRGDLSGDPSFVELLSRVREVTLEAYAHQDLPFEQLVDHLQPPRDLSHTPLFQVMFTTLPDVSGLELASSGLEFSFVETQSGTSKFDLTLSVAETESEWIGSIEYNTDLFDASTIERLAVHYGRLLEGVTADPQRRLSEVSLLSAEERRQVLVDWNTTRCDYPRDRCVHELFEEQAERTPEAPAVVFDEQRLTYGQLNARANRLAHHLRGLGVGPEVLVGICLDRSPEMVVALLGILKAGGAYVPLDPLLPTKRIRFMLEDTRAPVLLTQKRLLRDVTEGLRHVVCLDSRREEIARASDENPARSAAAADLAYVIYTSGSTGRAKGVMIEHGSLVNYTEAVVDAYQVTATDRVLQFASMSFDAHAEEIYPCLTRGGTLVLRTDAMLASYEGFLRTCGEWGLTLVTLPTAYWHELTAEMEAASLEVPASLRLMIVGSEAALPERVAAWVTRIGGGVRLLNGYGPTEVTVVATVAELGDPTGPHGTLLPVPIGRPLQNTRVYVLDPSLCVVPVGVPGELYVAGDGLARGYVKRPELTAERFLPDPFAYQPGSRFYRTGDLVRWRSDGQLEFLGRVDDQVKIRGFRIEPAEIESVLVQHEAVREAVVVGREDALQPRRLAAYVVPQQESPPAVEELRGFLREQLPDYMIPSAFVFLESIPLTRHGKVDRGALPSPETARPHLRKEYVAPRNEAEERLAEVWREVLGLDRVGVYDNFFELGGDSILSIQIVARANARGLHCTPMQLFQNQTIAELATVAGSLRQMTAEQGEVTGTAELTPIQRWFFTHAPQRAHHFNQSLLVEIRRAVDVDSLEEAVEHLPAHHDALRLRFRQQEGRRQAWHAAPGDASVFSRVDLSELAPQPQATSIERIAAETQQSLNLEAGPLLRAVYFDLGSKRAGRFLLVIHHLVVDAVSWRILLEDLLTAYQQLRQGQRIHLPSKTTSWQTWSQRLAEHAASGGFEKDAAYWLSTTTAEVEPCPVDCPDGENTVGSTETVVRWLEVSRTQALLKEVPLARHTQINELLLTAMVQAYRRWSGQCRLLVEVEGHGREELFEDVDVSRTVGWFTSVFPVFLEVGDAWDWGETLQLVKQRLRAIPRHGIGYGVLRYMGEDSIAGRLASVAQPDLVFNYLGQLDSAGASAEVLGGAFATAPESRGPEGWEGDSRGYVLLFSPAVVGGRLQMVWHYSRNLHRRETIERLATEYLASLEELISYCLAPPAGG